MIKNIIKILESYSNQYKKDTVKDFKSFMKKEVWISKPTYQDIYRYVMKIDWPDPSYSVWEIKALDMLIWKLKYPKQIQCNINLEDFWEKVLWCLCIDKQSELKTLTQIFNYSDLLSNYNDLIHKLWLSFVIVDMVIGNEWLWIKAMYQFKNKYIEIEDFDFDYNGLNSLYLTLIRLEEQCIQYFSFVK